MHGHPGAARPHPWADHNRGVDGATTRHNSNLVTVVSTDLAGVTPVNLDEITPLFHDQSVLPPRLGCGVVVIQGPPGGQDQRILGIRKLVAFPVVHRFEVRSANDWAALVQGGGARVVRRRTRPLQAARLVDTAVGDPRKLRRQGRHLVEDFCRTVVGGHRVSDRPSQIAQDLPVSASITWWFDGLSDELYPPVAVGEDPVLFGEARRGQHHIGKPGGLVEKDVLQHDEVAAVETLLDPRGVRLRQHQVLPHHEQALDGAARHFLHHDVEVHAVVLRQLDAPRVLEFGAHIRIGDPLVPGVEDRRRTRVVGALNVVLASQRVEAGGAHPQVPGHQHEIGQGIDVVRAVGVLGDPEGVVDAGLAGRRVGSRRTTDALGRHAGGDLRPLGGIRGERLLQRVEAGRVGGDELLVAQAFFDNGVGHGVEKPHVGARCELEMHIGDLGEPDGPRIGDDQARASAHRPLHFHRDDGMGLGGVGTGDEEEVRVTDLVDGVRHRAGAEHGHEPRDRWRVSRGRALMAVVGSERRSAELLHQVVLLDRASARRDKAQGVGTVRLFDVQ